MKQSLYRLRIPDHVVDLIRGMHPHLKKNVKASLKIILSDPHSGKALRDELLGLRSFRVGRLRIIYKLSAGEIQVVAIGPRTRIYTETFKLIRKSK